MSKNISNHQVTIINSREKLFKIELHEEENTFSTLSNEWSRLVESMKVPHPFYEPEWQFIWWKEFGEGKLKIFSMRDEKENLIAIFPLELKKNGTLRLIGGKDLSDYLDVIAHNEFSDTCLELFLQHLNNSELEWNQIKFRGIPNESPTLIILKKIIGDKLNLEIEEVCPVIKLPETWDIFLENLEPRFRRNLLRKIRKVETDQNIDFYESKDNLENDLNSFISLHSMSQPEKAEFWNNERKRFFFEMTKRMSEKKKLRLSFLRLDNYPIASTLSFIFNKKIYLYNSGYDTNTPEFSAGLVLLAHNINQAIEEKITHFDMLRGNESYKYDFGSIDTTIWSAIVPKVDL